MRALLNQLGNPQNHVPPVIHVAGTNGKGSVVAFMRAMLEASNYRVHSYTSPHLIDINERIAMPDGPINTQELCNILAEILKVNPDQPYTFFEVITAAAFVAFANTPADFCLAEVGLGGRCDPTNIIKHTVASVITQVDYDHTHILGDTLTKIAQEKAGIFRNNTPAFTYPQRKNIMNILQRESGGLLSVAPPLNKGALIGLKGQFQRENAALAVHVLENIPQVTLTPEMQAHGLKHAQWPGRLQKITDKLWLDGAHNVGAAKAITKHFKNSGIDNLTLILAMTQTKDPKEFLLALKDVIRYIYCVPLNTFQPTWPPHKIRDIAKKIGLKAHVFGDFQAALTQAQNTKSNTQTILICGSLMLVGQALRVLQEGFHHSA
ncbi:MAG: folylpolyglutamate synthase/dihydrofolate synthase family protein [Pseudomonadota bacterium]